MELCRRASITLSLFSLAVLFSPAFSVDPLFHFCFGPENYTAVSPYAANLNALTTLLYAKAPPTGFGLGSVGEAPDRASGLALCRGDVSSADCRACVAGAGKEIRSRCPSSRGAVIWYDNCELKYSDAEFFKAVDEAHRFYMWNLQAVPGALFTDEAKVFLGELAVEASANQNLYAAREKDRAGVEDSDSNKLYGLAQCTRDLSGENCKACLDGAVEEIKSCCDQKRGGRVVGGSCNVRYELYPFANAA